MTVNDPDDDEALAVFEWIAGIVVAVVIGIAVGVWVWWRG